MGIPHLTANLRPYSERADISGTAVVVDGPALAYHIFYLCCQHLRTSGLYNQPTYAQLGKTAVAWLDHLSECRITISAIFFDGHLPRSKRATRLERYCRRSKELNHFFLANATGLRRPSHPGLKERLSQPVPLFPERVAHRSSDLPPPPFAVQAVIEAIRASAYGPVTKVVPQEADLYCADHVRQHGSGIILTSDSDLLVYDLGSGGAVAFFSDMELHADTISACRFSPSRMCENFKITHEYGLSTLAFEMSIDPHTSMKKLIERARKAPEIGSTPDEFWEFMTQYRLRLPELPANCGLDELTRLDSGISEFVVQCLLPESRDADDQAESDDVEDNILMFLGQMPDKWSQTTTYEMSVSIRQIAYSTMQLVVKRRIPFLKEYRRMISVTTQGKHVEIPSVSDLQERCSELVSLMSRIHDSIDEAGLHWIILALHLDIEWSKREGKESNVLNVLRKETTPSGTTDVTSWNVVHLWALIHGTYYSVRMLNQLLGLASRQEEELPGPLQDLLKIVSAVPALHEWPDIESMQDLPARLKQKGGLNLLQELSGLTEAIQFLAKDKSAKKRRKEAQTSSQAKVHSGRQSNNPFAALGME